MSHGAEDAQAGLRAEVMRLQEAQTFSERSVESLDAQVRELHTLVAALAARIAALESERRAGAEAESESALDEPGLD